MIKAIRYAYIGSPMAKRLNSAREGCYYVAVKHCETDVKESLLYGPFAAIADAEAKAIALPFDWSRYTMRADKESA